MGRRRGQPKKQGEADPIIGLMNQHGLCTLLPRGTKTYQGPKGETTIDLVLASSEIAADLIRCSIPPVEHGSDHRTIETEFDVSTQERTVGQRLLFKNAPWAEFKAGYEHNSYVCEARGCRKRFKVCQTGSHTEWDVQEGAYVLCKWCPNHPYACSNVDIQKKVLLQVSCLM
jgi:hypothetical protein